MIFHMAQVSTQCWFPSIGYRFLGIHRAAGLGRGLHALEVAIHAVGPVVGVDGATGRALQEFVTWGHGPWPMARKVGNWKSGANRERSLTTEKYGWFYVEDFDGLRLFCHLVTILFHPVSWLLFQSSISHTTQHIWQLSNANCWRPGGWGTSFPLYSLCLCNHCLLRSESTCPFSLWQMFIYNFGDQIVLQVALGIYHLAVVAFGCCGHTGQPGFGRTRPQEIHCQSLMGFIVKGPCQATREKGSQQHQLHCWQMDCEGKKLGGPKLNFTPHVCLSTETAQAHMPADCARVTACNSWVVDFIHPNAQRWQKLCQNPPLYDALW